MTHEISSKLCIHLIQSEYFVTFNSLPEAASKDFQSKATQQKLLNAHHCRQEQMHLEQRLKVVSGLMPTRAWVLQPMLPWLQQHMPFKLTQLEIHEQGSTHAGRNSRSLLHISYLPSYIIHGCSCSALQAPESHSRCAGNCGDYGHILSSVHYFCCGLILYLAEISIAILPFSCPQEYLRAPSIKLL